MKYKVAIKLGDSYSKETRGYLASSRIRGHWLAKYWPECDDWFYPEDFPQYKNDFFNPDNQMKILKDYDAVVFNKTYEHKLAKRLKENGQFVIVDMCDPDHLLTHSSEQRKKDCLETLKYADVVVTNGEVLKESISKVYPKEIEIIPDRLDLESCYPKKKEHRKKLKKIVWYGYSENLRVLEPYMKDIINMGIEIMIISDKFFDNLMLPGLKNDPKELITFKNWHPDTVNQQIIESDVAFVGRDLDPYLSKFKSSNRQNLAEALKMPVAYDIDDLKKLKTQFAREQNAEQGYYNVRRYFDVRHSVSAYDTIIKRLLITKIGVK